ncbi:MAG: hypothetical protein E7I13_04720 [Negativicoccus succinicivorans]|nr:hypothetical protein [Negativicoccus succinicivorans]
MRITNQPYGQGGDFYAVDLISDRHGILDAGSFHYGFDGFLLEIFGEPKKMLAGELRQSVMMSFVLQ